MVMKGRIKREKYIYELYNLIYNIYRIIYIKRIYIYQKNVYGAIVCYMAGWIKKHVCIYRLYYI